jgi:hypothetical protein
LQPKEKNVALVDLLDRLLEKGVAARGEVSVRLADVDLIYVGIALLVTSASKLKRSTTDDAQLTEEDQAYLARLEHAITQAEAAIPKRIEGEEPAEIERGLARLVLTLVELIRRLMEREALRQVRAHQLAPREVQKLGMALKTLAAKMEQIKHIFELDDEDLNLDLGPLGELL